MTVTIPATQSKRVVEDIDSTSSQFAQIQEQIKQLDNASPGKQQGIVFHKATSLQNETLSLNGSDNGLFMWSQTADDVIIRVRCDPGTRARDVNVTLSATGQLKVCIKSIVVVCATLLHRVWDENKLPFASEEETLNKAMSWEVEDLSHENKRCVVIHLAKRPPHEGIKIWWKRVFNEGDEKEVDVTKIGSRNKAASEAAQKVWKEAHEIFLANRARERELRERQGSSDS